MINHIIVEGPRLPITELVQNTDNARDSIKHLNNLCEPDQHHLRICDIISSQSERKFTTSRLLLFVVITLKFYRRIQCISQLTLELMRTLM